jgi:hypothetical protein
MNDRGLLFFFSILTVMLLYMLMPLQHILGVSPPFIIQQFSDQSNDWLAPALSSLSSQSPIIDNHTKTNCTKDMFIPDIGGVAYTSDGELLTDTIWLRQPFQDPSISKDTSLVIEKINVSEPIKLKSLDDSAIKINASKIVPLNVTNGLVNTTASGYHTATYNFTSKKGSIMIVEKKSPIFYIIAFRTNAEKFNDYWPKIKNMLDSFDITKSQSEISHGSFLIYNNTLLGMKIKYPKDWEPDPFVGKRTDFAKLVPDPRWIKTVFSLTIQTVSSPEIPLHSDYRSSVVWDFRYKNWSKTIQQISLIPPGSTKYIENKVTGTPDFSNSDGSSSHVDLYFNLTKIGSPKNYVVISDSYSQFLRNGQMCSLRDLTRWVSLPPPQIRIDTNPNSVILRPGDKKTIAIHANSSADLPSVISLNATSDKFVTFHFHPQSIILSSHGKGSSTLEIVASNKLIDNENGTKDITVPILGHVSFPQGVIDTATGRTVKGPIEPVMGIKTYVPITVSNPPSFQEQINDIIHQSNSTLTELQVLIATIASIATSIIGVFTALFLKSRKDRKKREHHRSKPPDRGTS